MSIDEMIKDCEAKVREDETIVFAIGAGRIFPKLGMMKAQKKAMKVIQKQDGFVGIHLIDLWHTLLIYDTLNHAKSARNVLISKGMELGEIVPIMIPKEGVIE